MWTISLRITSSKMNKVSIHLPIISKRCISTTAATLVGKKNIRKFDIPSQWRGTRDFRKKQLENPHPQIPLETFGVRPTGYKDEHGEFVEVPEQIPQLVVPDLTGFTLKPYVSYRTPKIVQSEFTAEDLFNAVYAKKIIDDWNTKQLNEDGTPKSPSKEELLDAETALRLARKTGADIF